MWGADRLKLKSLFNCFDILTYKTPNRISQGQLPFQRQMQYSTTQYLNVKLNTADDVHDDRVSHLQEFGN